MRFSDKIKTYNFWVSIAGVVFLIINLIGKKFNFTIDEGEYNDLFTTFCSILVLLGIIVPPTNFKGRVFYQYEDNSNYLENGDKDDDDGTKEDDKVENDSIEEDKDE